MKGFVAVAIFVAALGLLSPGNASATLSLDLGFDPTEICPGNPVQFFFDLENVGDQAETVTLSVTFSYEGYEFGPFEGQFPMAAGEEFAKEINLYVPPMAPPGTLHIAVTATDSGGSVDDSADLVILQCGPAFGGNGAKLLIQNTRKAVQELGVK